MKQGLAFTPDGPLTLQDLHEILESSNEAGSPSSSVVEIRTPMVGDRRQVTVTVTNEIWRKPPPPPAPEPEAPQPDTQED